MKKTFIYGLKDPRTDEIRYVGKSDNPKNRYSRHIRNAKNPKTKCYCWIKSLLDLGLKPILIILEEVSIDIWGEKEDYWINQFSNLTNLLDGGKFCPMSIPEIAKKAALSNMGRKASNETKSLLSKIRKEEWKNGSRIGGWKHSDNFKIKRTEEAKNIWKNRTIEEKARVGLLISKGKSKPIIQLDLDMKIIKIWESAKAAELIYSPKTKGRIGKSIKNNKIFKGFYWKYKNDLLVINQINN